MRLTSVLSALPLPIVQAPMAGGPSTPQLAGAVSRAGALGFLAAGYLSPERVRADIETLRESFEGPFGVNLFCAAGEPADPASVTAYANHLADEAQRAGVALGQPRFDDDGFAAKLDVVRDTAPAVVSFTFGLPTPEVVADLQGQGCEVWATVTSVAEARAARDVGVDALVVQGVEAGGHRGVFADVEDQSDLTLLAALALIGAAVHATHGGRRVDHDRRRSGRRARGRGQRRPGGDRAAAGHRGRDLGGPARRHRARRADRAHPRVQRAHRARHRQPLASRARRLRAGRLPRGPLPHLAAARPRTRGRGRRSD